MGPASILDIAPRPIALSPSRLRELTRDEIDYRIRRIVRSVRYELDVDGHSFRILGPDMSYHDVDRGLADGLKIFGPGVAVDDVLLFHEARRNFDLCLEDSWSGLFIAKQTAGWEDEELVLIHLDDHSDMMPTLLHIDEDRVIDTSSGQVFDPDAPDSWRSSILSGCVSIGNFVTPLFYSKRMLHVRHLNNIATSVHGVCGVERFTRRYELVPDLGFAMVRKTPRIGAHSAGTYRGGPDAQTLLNDLPEGRVIVHIDLDYFIDDLNGNPNALELPTDVAQRAALPKLDAFFAALRATGRPVERWIVATSPGFCAASHWPWLFDELDWRIEAAAVLMVRERWET